MEEEGFVFIPDEAKRYFEMTLDDGKGNPEWDD